MKIIPPINSYRALNKHPGIGLMTTMQIQQPAKELNYEANETALFFKQERSHTIGVVLPNFLHNQVKCEPINNSLFIHKLKNGWKNYKLQKSKLYRM